MNFKTFWLKAVVLKGEPLGSPREEFLIPGRKFVTGGIGEEKLWLKRT